MEIQVINSVELSVNRALWGEVIPSLRKVSLEINSEENLVCINFYHHGEVTEGVELLLSRISVLQGRVRRAMQLRTKILISRRIPMPLQGSSRTLLVYTHRG
jgi:hypothetical protein